MCGRDGGREGERERERDREREREREYEREKEICAWLHACHMSAPPQVFDPLAACVVSSISNPQEHVFCYTTITGIPRFVAFACPCRDKESAIPATKSSKSRIQWAGDGGQNILD